MTVSKEGDSKLTPEQAIKMVLELLESPYVQDNVQKLGILGATDIECAIKILKRAGMTNEKT